jgi:PHP domain
MQLSKITTIAAIFLTLSIISKAVIAGELIQLAGVMHVHSTYSSGRYSIEALVARAGEKHLEVLVLTDHDLVAMEYGLFPFRNLIKKREERKSVLQAGPLKFISEIERLNKQQQSVLIIPGVQSSPFYYWEGNPFGKGLSAHNYRKELLLVGMSSPDDYDNLPLLHGGFSIRYVKDLLPRFMIFFAVFILSIYLISQKGKTRLWGLVIALLSIALMVDHHPFKSSRFDAYHGDQRTAPYQEVIDYVGSRGGLVFWAHPESNYSKAGVELGPIKMVTEHYPADLVESKNYTGFAAIYGDSSSAGKAGRYWDQVLLDYCKGNRNHPAWAIAGADFHEEQKGFDLDTFQTIFLVKNKRPKEVLQALEHGRIYAVRKSEGMRLALDQFQIKDKSTGKTVIMGEEMNARGAPVVEGRLSASDNGRHAVSVSVIRGGQQAWFFEGQTPLDFQLADQGQWRGKTFYRLEVKGREGGYLLSNPIFVTRTND